MNFQLIFVTETNNSCKSDDWYIKEIINNFYNVDKKYLKISFIHMEGKANYCKKKKKISQLIKDFSYGNKDAESAVIYCIDTDDYDYNFDDRKLNSDIENYCKANEYEMVWFCKDIERVLMGSKIDNHKKKKVNVDFIRKQLIKTISVSTLSADSYKNNTSNILNILDKYAPYLIRKEHEQGD